jgi:hypothetical protein
LDQYVHLLNNKVVQAVHEDRAMAQNYVNFARIKSAAKREQNRKVESQRLMSAKANIKGTVIKNSGKQDSKENI